MISVLHSVLSSFASAFLVASAGLEVPFGTLRGSSAAVHGIVRSWLEALRTLVGVKAIGIAAGTVLVCRTKVPASPIGREFAVRDIVLPRVGLILSSRLGCLSLLSD